MKTSRVFLFAVLLLHSGIGCEPRKGPEAPDPIPNPPGDPNQPLPNPAAVGQPIGPIATPIGPAGGRGGFGGIGGIAGGIVTASLSHGGGRGGAHAP